jgi:recombination protein RecT
VAFAAECGFALEAVRKSEYLAKAAQNDLDSFKFAILSVASVGLSLNPVLQYAALIPRSPKKGAPAVVVFDPMYQGLIKLANDSGAIHDVNSAVVYESDTFEYELGTSAKLIHKPALHLSRKERGRQICVYCVAYT